MTDGQDAEKGGARYEQSGSREQAAKNMSAAVHERTCVFARREAGRPKDQSRQHRLPVVECDSDVCLFWEFLANVEKNFFVEKTATEKGNKTATEALLYG